MATYLTLSSKKPKVQGHTIMVRSSLTPDPQQLQSFPNPRGSPKVFAHPVKHSCSEPAFPTWFYKAENQQPEEDQDSGQKTKKSVSPLHNMESRTPPPKPSPTSMFLGPPTPPPTASATATAAVEPQRKPNAPRVCPTTKIPSTLGILMV